MKVLLTENDVLSNEPEASGFDGLLLEIRSHLIGAYASLTILEALVELDDTTDIFQRYNRMFVPITAGLRNTLCILICNLTDEKDERNPQPSVFRLAKMTKSDQESEYGTKIEELLQKLENHRSTIKDIRKFRDSRAAHWDVQINLEDPLLSLSAERELLSAIQCIHDAVSGGKWALQNFGTDQVKQMLLKIDHEVR